MLTGIPRSGTTLVCHLLHKLPNTVALSEPIGPDMFADLPDNEAVCDAIERFYAKMRRSAYGRGVAISRNNDGEVPDNHFSQTRDERGRRQMLAPVGKIKIDKQLTRDFDLIVKNPIMFTALLPTLAKRLPCYAIVRNPLARMASGTSTRKMGNENRPKAQERRRPPAAANRRGAPVTTGGARRGAVVPALRFDEEISARLTGISDVHERRLTLLSWFFERYEQELPGDHILRYEDIIASGGKALSAIVPAAEGLNEPLQSRNLNELYDREEMLRLGERLLKSEGAYWRFYSRESVEEILGQISDGNA